MFSRNSSILFIGVTISIVRNTLGIGILPDVDADRVFDQELYQSVLDPQLCARQLQHIRNEDLSLRLEFLDSGLRLPRAILLGNFFDFGNFPQCLSINKEVEDMIIQGKHCMINVPPDFSALQSDHYDLMGLSNEKNIRLMNEIEKNRDLLLAREGISAVLPSRTGPGGSLNFMVSICVPQACTVKEALGDTIFNFTGDIGENFSVMSCRLPNDKPFVAADYVAWTIFSLIGLITVLSTMYDVRHTLILKKDPKEANELYSAFSVYKNSCKIINLKTKPGTLECLDGIRSLSIMWVILGHTFMIQRLLFLANPLNVFEWYASTKAIWMKAAPLAVDTFFLLSGLLVVYTTASKFTAIKLLKSLHLFYLHRFLRLMPVLAAVILFVSSIQLHVGDGAAWSVVARDVEACRSYWWTPLLHLQNFVKPQGGCVPESWYLAIDMHLHILSPIVLFWVFSGAKRPAWIALLSTFVTSLMAASIYIFVKDISRENSDDSFIYYYVNILTRAPPFFVGMIYGYLLHTFRDKKYGLSKAAGYSITVFVLTLTALVLYCSHLHLHGDISWTVEKIFLCFERTTWVICVGWIIFACVNGYAGPINWFLSMSVWKIPSRISYSMYLSHMLIITYAHNSRYSVSLVYLTVPFFMFDFMGYLYLTMFVSFFMTAIIELPFATLFKILLMGENKTQKKPISNPANGVKLAACHQKGTIKEKKKR